MAKILWTLMDDRRGSVSQALGVIGALDESKFSVVEKNIVYNRWAALPNFIRGASLLGITEESKAEISAPYPDYVLSISRRTAPIARYIKKQSPQTKLIQLMHPGNSGLNDFSLVVVPEHDKNKKYTANIHYIVGCPHRVTKEYLDKARTEWQNEFASLPRPLTAVIVGGAIKKRPFPPQDALKFAEAICRLKKQIGGSILITTSRRTGEEAQNIIMNELQGIPQYAYLWGDTRKNPYSGFLACADNIVVTGDSVSMCCEATGTGKPLYLFIGSNNWMTPKHFRFVQSMLDKKCAVLLDDDTAATFQPQSKLNSASEIAELIEKL
ncbi:MAG: mitochondrial fission ELM1 family protein [Alphaproteobacteria bacterium]|nr:mitochondrial fission ELM1 family protein [Alphaproteobacteria bacterium]